LLKELFHNPNFIHEFSRTHGYELLGMKGINSKHFTVPYLESFLYDNSLTNVHFFLTKIKPKVIDNNFNILMPSPGHIVSDSGLYGTIPQLSNVLVKTKNFDTDILSQTDYISKSYTFPYNYQLSNMGWVNYDLINSQSGVETVWPVFSLEKIYSIQNYNSYRAFHPSNTDDYAINLLSEVSKLNMDLI